MNAARSGIINWCSCNEQNGVLVKIFGSSKLVILSSRERVSRRYYFYHDAFNVCGTLANLAKMTSLTWEKFMGFLDEVQSLEVCDLIWRANGVEFAVAIVLARVSLSRIWCVSSYMTAPTARSEAPRQRKVMPDLKDALKGRCWQDYETGYCISYSGD